MLWIAHLLWLWKIFSNFVLSFPLRLRHKEEYEDGAEEGHAGEDEVAGSGADGVANDGDQQGHQEGDQPVEGRAEGGGDGSRLRGDELHVEYPGNGTKPQREGRDEHHEGDEWKEADAVHLIIFLPLRDKTLLRDDSPCPWRRGHSELS